MYLYWVRHRSQKFQLDDWLDCFLDDSHHHHCLGILFVNCILWKDQNYFYSLRLNKMLVFVYACIDNFLLTNWHLLTWSLLMNQKLRIKKIIQLNENHTKNGTNIWCINHFCFEFNHSYKIIIDLLCSQNKN